MGGILWTNQKQDKQSDLAELYYKKIVHNELTTADSPKEQVQLNISMSDVTYGSVYLISILMNDGGLTEGYRAVGITGEVTGEYGKTTLLFDISFILDYYFEKQQNLIFNIRKDNKTFSVSTTMANIMGSRGQSLAKGISNNEDSYNIEKLTIIGNTVKNNNIQVSLNLSAQIFSTNTTSLFYIIKKAKENLLKLSSEEKGEERTFFTVYKSEVQTTKNKQVLFNNTKIPASALCNGEFNHLILIEFFDYNAKTNISSYETSVDNLMGKGSHFITKGTEVLDVNIKCDLIKEFTFLNYLQGGLQIALNIGIDFTGSNGNPQDPSSLHYLNLNQMNSYEKAIRSCGDILAYYDYDQLFPVYGYGAHLGNNGVSHCFPINMDVNDPNIKSIDGVLACYRQLTSNINLSGPTYFAPLIINMVNNVKKENNPMVYNILMILTDGMINDMDATINALVEASYLPISVIIIGIGTNDFGNMDILDADENPLFDRNGRKAARDLVQFVPFYKFQNNGVLLASQVLEEVPGQVVDYYKMIKMPPGDPIINI